MIDYNKTRNMSPLPRNKLRGFPLEGKKRLSAFRFFPGDSSHDINVGDFSLGFD